MHGNMSVPGEAWSHGAVSEGTGHCVTVDRQRQANLVSLMKGVTSAGARGSKAWMLPCWPVTQ